MDKASGNKIDFQAHRDAFIQNITWMGLKENVVSEKTIKIVWSASEMPSVIYVTAYPTQQRHGTGVPATENTTRLDYKLQHVYAVTK